MTTKVSIPRHGASTIITIGTIKMQTKGSADMNLDGAQGQTRDPHGISRS